MYTDYLMLAMPSNTNNITRPKADDTPYLMWDGCYIYWDETTLVLFEESEE
jgi:hypothetical protein